MNETIAFESEKSYGSNIRIKSQIGTLELSYVKTIKYTEHEHPYDKTKYYIYTFLNKNNDDIVNFASDNILTISKHKYINTYEIK